jgi:hypothetical protein
VAIQTNALPPSLLTEIQEMQRRITALERKPKLGSVNQPMPFSSYQSPSVEGTVGENEGPHTLGIINSTGLNQPVVIMQIPFHLPWTSAGTPDVEVRVWVRDLTTNGKTREFTINKTSDYPAPNNGFTRRLTLSWIHPQPIGFDDPNVWKGFVIEYKVLKRQTIDGEALTVGMGMPHLITGVPLGTFQEETTDGNPRIDGVLTPTDGGPATWG